MMNNRGSYIGRPKSNVPQGTAERPTINPHGTVSISKQGDKQSHQEMINKIMEIVPKIEINAALTNGFSRDSLKQGSGPIFYNLFALLLYAIDGGFKVDYISNNPDMIVSLAGLFGYKGNSTKSNFTSIGALHSWTHCLSILQWFSELANYAYIFQLALNDKTFEEDHNSLGLSCFSNKNEESYQSFLENSIQLLSQQNEDLSYSIESKRMAIRNQHNMQRQLSVVEKEVQKEKEFQYRIEQEIQKINGDLNDGYAQLKEKQEESVRAISKELELKFVLERLMYEITNQELPPDQCENVKLEIRNIKNTIMEINEKMNEQDNKNAAANTASLEAFTDKASQLRKLAEKLKASHLYNECDVKPVLPSLSYTDFNAILKKTEENSQINIDTENSIESVFKEREFAQYFRRQEQFVSKLENRFMKEQQDMLAKEREIQALEIKQSTLKEVIFQISKSKETKIGKNSQNKETKRNLETQASKLESEINFLTIECGRKLAEKNSEMAQVKDLIEQVKISKEAAQEQRRHRNEQLSQAKQRLQQLKGSLVQQVGRYKSALVSLFAKAQKKTINSA